MNTKRNRKQEFGTMVSNWQQPLPLPRKIWMAFRNLGIRVVKRQNCCGHHGEPGC